MADERISGIVDVPGHVDFIRNMVAGAHGVDVVILVIAADDGVMPQTREHLDILTLMGARSGLVALTKTDLVEKQRLASIVEDVRKYLVGTFLEKSALCCISNLTGEGFDDFFQALNEAVSTCQARDSSGLFRLWVERVFHVHGFGTVLSGVPTSGQVQVGDKLKLLPDGLTGRVRKLEVYGKSAQTGLAGECVALNLTNIDPATLARGKVLVEDGAFTTVSMAEAELWILDDRPRPLEDYSEVHLYIGTAEVMAHVAILDAPQIAPGESRLVQLRLNKPLGLAAGDRFVIRASMAGLAQGRLTTIGGGRILGTGNKRLRRNRPWTLATLSARRDALDHPTAWCATHLREANAPLTIEVLARRAQRRIETVQSAIEQLRKQGEILPVESKGFVHRDTLEQAKQKVTEALETFHADNPTRMGIVQEELQKQVDIDPAVCNLALEEAIQKGAVVHRNRVLALAGLDVQLSEQEQALCRRIEQTLHQGHLRPPPAGGSGPIAGRCIEPIGGYAPVAFRSWSSRSA